MKKVLSMLLALVMVMSLSVGTMAFAVGTSPKKAANREGTYKVEVIDHNTRYPTDVVVYKPVGVTPKVGVVFYAGNPVDYRDYGTLLKRVASAGYLVISPEFPLDTAILNWAAGEEYMKHYPEVEEWFFMGHSHGGGTAVWEATLKPELFKGLILISAVSFPCHLPDGYPVIRLNTYAVSKRATENFSALDFISDIRDDADPTADIFGRISVTGNGNLDKPGIYTVNYYVTDSEGNRSNVAHLIVVVTK